MSPSEIHEKSLEDLVVQSLIQEGGYVPGHPADFDRELGLDVPKLLAFLRDTQPGVWEKLNLDHDLSRRKFLERLKSELATRGVIDVLRKGVRHGPAHVDLYYPRPTPGNETAARLFEKNIFSVTRQLRYSLRGEQSLDVVLFINGIPLISMELKNRFTGQTYQDAIRQYKENRDPREMLFRFKRMLVHFAVDDEEVYMTTRLAGKETWFLPFNKGDQGGKGNPPDPHGPATSYLWREILTRDSLADILEHYVQVIKEEVRDGKRIEEKQIFPRFHQLEAVRKLLADARNHGVGRRYLIQHSTGSGKSNTIAWLAHQLVSLKKEGRPVFDSIIVVTDRRVLDRQIKNTVRQFAQVREVVGHAQRARDLADMLHQGKKIIITTMQKFPFILDAIHGELRDRRFAILVDEAHSSQGGKLMSAMARVLKGLDLPEDADEEDLLNLLAEARRLPENASLFAFTATPKNKTLELFGERVEDADGVHYRPFHLYSMRQAIEEGFILDVLAHYTPVRSYYRLIKRVEDDPLMDARRAHQKLRRFVEHHEFAIRKKAEIMIDHFHRYVRHKIGGKARAMVVTSSVDQAIEYFFAFQAYLRQIRSPFKALVAFSGEREYKGRVVSEAILNGFPETQTPKKFRSEPYRFLIVAEKYQTGFDEPLLHTMYVDKPLSGIRAVQTLSRLNRAYPGKHDTFVLDFVNDEDTIREAFAPYYQGTILIGETDPNRLNDLLYELREAQLFSEDEVDQVVSAFLKNAPRPRFEPLLDEIARRFMNDLGKEDQIRFKRRAKAYVRAYRFLANLLDYSSTEWEKYAVFLELLIPKLPTPETEDLARDVLKYVDMASYRIEVREKRPIYLSGEEGQLEPVSPSSRGSIPEPELEPLSRIIQEFNERFGNIDWKDEDSVKAFLFEKMPEKLRRDEGVALALRQGDPQNARVELERAIKEVLLDHMEDHLQLYKEANTSREFLQFLVDTMARLLFHSSSANG